MNGQLVFLVHMKNDVLLETFLLNDTTPISFIFIIPFFFSTTHILFHVLLVPSHRCVCTYFSFCPILFAVSSPYRNIPFALNNSSKVFERVWAVLAFPFSLSYIQNFFALSKFFLLHAFSLALTVSLKTIFLTIWFFSTQFIFVISIFFHIALLLSSFLLQFFSFSPLFPSFAFG